MQAMTGNKECDILLLCLTRALLLRQLCDLGVLGNLIIVGPG
jgi:hypothetical protein